MKTALDTPHSRSLKGQSTVKDARHDLEPDWSCVHAQSLHLNGGCRNVTEQMQSEGCVSAPSYRLTQRAPPREQVKTLFHRWISLSSHPSGWRTATSESLRSLKVQSEWGPAVIFLLRPSLLATQSLLEFWRPYAGLILLTGCHWWDKHHRAEQNMQHIDP